MGEELTETPGAPGDARRRQGQALCLAQRLVALGTVAVSVRSRLTLR